MKLAGEWLLKAMSEKDVPSARRVVMVVGLLLFAPALLAGLMRWAPGSFAECFIAWTLTCGGVYVGGSFAPKSPPPPPAPTP